MAVATRANLHLVQKLFLSQAIESNRGVPMTSKLLSLIGLTLLLNVFDALPANARSALWCGGEISDFIYVRLVNQPRTRGVGLRFPVSDFDPAVRKIIDPIVPPANPEASPGCEDNPLHIGSLGSFLGGMSANQPNRLALMAENGFKSACRRFGETIVGDFTVCITDQGRDFAPPEARTMYAMARSEIYQTPTGDPFIVNCDFSMRGTPPRDFCRVRYNLEPGLKFFYAYLEVEIDLIELIEFDRRYRSKQLELRYPKIDVGKRPERLRLQTPLVPSRP